MRAVALVGLASSVERTTSGWRRRECGWPVSTDRLDGSRSGRASLRCPRAGNRYRARTRDQRVVLRARQHRPFHRPVSPDPVAVAAHVGRPRMDARPSFVRDRCGPGRTGSVSPRCAVTSPRSRTRMTGTSARRRVSPPRSFVRMLSGCEGSSPGTATRGEHVADGRLVANSIAGRLAGSD